MEIPRRKLLGMTWGVTLFLVITFKNFVVHNIDNLVAHVYILYPLCDILWSIHET